MSQIMYNYPAMLAHAGEMAGYAGAMHAVGADIASEQAALAGALAGRHRHELPGVAGAVEHQPRGAGPRLPRDGHHPRDEHHVDERPRCGRRRQVGWLRIGGR